MPLHVLTSRATLSQVRRTCSADVEAVGHVHDPVVRVEFEDGRYAVVVLLDFVTKRGADLDRLGAEQGTYSTQSHTHTHS